MPALKFDNPNPRGKDYVRFDGRDLEDFKTLIDRKFNATTHSKQVKDMERVVEALKQNPGYKLRIEVPSNNAFNNVNRLLQKADVPKGLIEVLKVKWP